jgi:hypothetical protein
LTDGGDFVENDVAGDFVENDVAVCFVEDTGWWDPLMST